MLQSRAVVACLLVLTSAVIAFVPVAGAGQPGQEVPFARLAPAGDARAETGAAPQRLRQHDRQRVKDDADKPKRARGARRARNQRRGQASTRNGAQRGGPVELRSGVIPGAEQRARRAGAAETRYIVVVKAGRLGGQAAVAALSDESGVIPTHIYRHALDGFAAYLTPDAKRALERDPRVTSITEDRQLFHAAQTLPAGIDRVDADLHPGAQIDGADQGVDVDIAIIDTGIDLTHDDLNVHYFTNCSPSLHNESRFDPDGHGTHVAGTAAARDNDKGVVGVAPGARLWAMRVAENDGDIFESYVIACLDLVTIYAQVPPDDAETEDTIDVVNISLGRTGRDGPCNSEPFHQAICSAVAAGVTIAVAAGNSVTRAAREVPAAYNQVITVSALADKDGRPGGLAGNFPAICQAPQKDDGLATFSNFGRDIDIAAPGIGVLSTFPTYFRPRCFNALGNGYEVLSGTSMSSPHVAGAAALIKAANPGFTPAQVKAELLATREDVHMLGDPDGIDEGILNLGDPAGTTQPSLSVNARNRAKEDTRFPIRVNATDPDGIDRVILHRCTPVCRQVATDRTAPYRFVRRHGTPGRVRYLVRAVDNADDIADEFETIRITKEKKRRRARRR